MGYLARLFFPTLLLIACLGVPLRLTAQTAGTDSSAYLIDAKVGGVDVDLMWDGYWRMSLVAGGTFGGEASENAFTGLAQGLTFFQEPDLILTLWLRNRWFLQTSFIEGFERNTYRAGYVGQGDEFVREVVMGNAGVTANSYAGINVPAPQYNTPGLVAKFGTPKSDHEILLRFDPTESQSKIFQGQYEVSVQEIGLPEFVEGKYFILPDTNITNVRVYLEDRLGGITGTDGMGTTRRYRRAQPVEYFVDLDLGLVELNEAHDGQVVVYFENSRGEAVGGYTVEDFIVTPDTTGLRPDLSAGTFEPFDFAVTTVNPYDTAGRGFHFTSRVDIGGINHLVVYTPGLFSPFERQNVYLSERPLPDESWRVRSLIKNRGTLYPTGTLDYNFVPDPSEKTLTVYDATTGGGAKDLRLPSNRYPFADADPEVYGPGRETESDKISRILVLAIRENNSNYYLGTSVVEGSVVVYVNGVQDKTVELTDEGNLEFNRFVYIDDWIEVFYRTESLDMLGGDLFVYQGNRFQLTPRLSWELAESFRWNISPNRTVEEYSQSQGEIGVASVLNWEAEDVGFRIIGDTTFSTPDTAGTLRLYGMDRGGISLPLYDSAVFAAPAWIPQVEGIRQPLNRYDYTSYDALGGQVLKDYLWSGATDTGKDGPGLAADREGDPGEGRVLDLRFNLGAGEWAAGDVLADSAGPIDLSSYTAIEIPMQFRDRSGFQPDVLLQMGEIGESADHHGDGGVNLVDAGAYVEWDISSLPVSNWITSDFETAWESPGTWAIIRIPLSAAHRTKLGSVRSWRLVVDGTPGAASGRLIAGAPRLVGAALRTEIRDGTALVSNNSVTGGDVTDNSLKSAYSEVAELFHPNGESNQVMEIQWGTQVPGGADLSGSQRWEVAGWFDGVPIEAYSTLAFYVNTEVSHGFITAQITDDDGKGITATWNAINAGWDRITISIPQASAMSSGGNGPVAVTVDEDAGELTRFVLMGADRDGDGSRSLDSGTIYLDEIHFTSPTYSVTGGVEFQGHWRYNDDVAAINNFPVLGDISLSGGTKVSGGKVFSGLDRGSTVVTGEVAADADVLGIGVTTDWRITFDKGDSTWSGSHKLRIPARYKFFWFGESYSRSITGDDFTFSRMNDINVKLGPGSIRTYSEASYDGMSLVQAWGGTTGWLGKIWETSLDVRYILNTGEIPKDSHGYFGSWVRDYVYLTPAAGLISREARHTFGGRVTWGPVEIHWSPEIDIKTARVPSWNQENRWAGILSLPLHFQKWSLTTSYRRDLRQKKDTSFLSNAGFDDDWNIYFDEMAGNWPIVTYVPFRELFTTEDGDIFADGTDGLLEADYEVEWALGFNRSMENSFKDLLVPSSADASMGRHYQRKGDTVGWENEWRYSVGFQAMNLFGQFGTYPFFTFYNNEELSSLYELSLADYNGTPAPSPGDFLWQIEWAFIGNRDRRLVLDHRIDWNWDIDSRLTSQEAHLEYQWRTSSKDSLDLPFFERGISRENHIENIERIAIQGFYPWKDAPPSNLFDIGFILYHESAWVFQDAGHLKGWLALGFGSGFGGEFTNGWEIGLEAEIRL